MNEIKIDTREVDRIARQLNVKREAIGRRMAFQIEKRAKELAPFDTHALQNSIYVVTQKQDGYSKASSAAKNANPSVTTTQHPTPTGNVIANVGPSVDYAEYQEFGTSKMAAQPYLTPAVEEITQKYNSGDEWKELVE